MEEGKGDVYFGEGGGEQESKENVIEDGGWQECLNIRQSRMLTPGWK